MFLDTKGYYSVTKSGRVFSHRRNIWMSPLREKKGYLSQIFHVDGRVARFKIHRLVLLAYVGDSDLQVNHKNGIKDDNRLSNLEYCTQSENIRHADRAGLRRSPSGERNSKAKLTQRDVDKIRSSKLSNVKLGEKYNVSSSQIGKIKNRKAWAN